MTTGSAALWTLTATTLTLAGLMLSGCGGASEGAESGVPAVSRAYVEVVTDLKKAALSNEPYDAARHARRLTKPERAVIDGFCEFAWQTPVNHLVHLLDQHTYVVLRITHLAELSYRGAPAAYSAKDASIEALMGKLRRIIQLRSLNGSLIRRYSQACYS